MVFHNIVPIKNGKPEIVMWWGAALSNGTVAEMMRRLRKRDVVRALAGALSAKPKVGERYLR